MSPEARALLRERRRRIGRIRKRVVATCLTTFAVAWAAIFFQMVAGRDPALSHAKASTSATHAAKSTTSRKKKTSSSTTAATRSSESSDQSESTSSSSTQSSSPAPVTTSQS